MEAVLSSSKDLQEQKRFCKYLIKFISKHYLAYGCGNPNNVHKFVPGWLQTRVYLVLLGDNFQRNLH